MFKKEDPLGRWTNINLEDCVEIMDHKRVPINSNQRQKRLGNIPYYGATGRVGWIDDYLFDEELVLVGEDAAPFLDKYANKAYVISGKSWVNNHAHVLKGIKSVLLNRFLCHFLNQFDYHEYVTGTTRLKLNQHNLKRISISFPSLAEQKRIVAKIESIFSRIDATHERLEALASRVGSFSNNLNMLRDSILKQAFEGKLVPQDPNDEPTAILPKIMNLNPKFNTQESRKYNLPKGWIQTTFGSVIKRSNEKFEPQNSDDTAFLGLEHIESGSGNILGRGHSAQTKSIKTVFRAGDTLYGKLRPYLNKVCVPNFDGVCSTDILVFPSSPNFVNKYLAYFLSTNEFVRFANKNSMGIQHPRVKFSTISEYVLAIPPLAEQKRIVAKIESIFDRIDVNVLYENHVTRSFMFSSIQRGLFFLITLMAFLVENALGEVSRL